MPERDGCRSAPSKSVNAVVAVKIVSPKGARVTEKVFVLSNRAAQQLEIRGEVPALQRIG